MSANTDNTNTGPDRFRIDYNRQRWYMDDLPADDIAPAADKEAKWPSVSTIAKVAGGDWSDVRMKMAAEWIKGRPDITLDNLPADMMADELKAAGRAALDATATRGTQIHEVIESYAAGHAVTGEGLNADAQPFFASARSFLGRETPIIEHAEMVAINREIGYAGTFDAYGYLPHFDPDVGAIIDYKTRNAHRLGVGECWQMAAYANAEYWIEETAEGWRRIKPPAIEVGYLVSITKEGYRVYVVDIAAAWEGFKMARELWALNHAGIRPLKLGQHDGPQPWHDRDLWLRDRIDVVASGGGLEHLLPRWPEDVPKPKRCTEPYTDAQIDALVPAIEYAEKMIEAPFGESDPATPAPEPRTAKEAPPAPANTMPMPDEGEMMPEALPSIARRFDALPEGAADFCRAMTMEANTAGLPFGGLEAEPTVRRVHLARSLILACERRMTRSALSALVRVVEEDKADERQTLTVGVRLGLLDQHEAKTLAALVSVAAPEQDGLPSGPMPTEAAESPSSDDPQTVEVVTDTILGPVVDSYDADALAAMKVAELKDLCRAAGLPVSGAKQDLIGRLLDADTSPNTTQPKEVQQ